MTIAQTPSPAVSMLARSYGLGVQLGLHMHREAQLLFAASGVMQVTTPKGRWLVPPQRAVWLPPLLEHSVDMLTAIEMRTLYVAPDWIASHPRASGLAREFVVRVGALLRELVLALFEASDKGERTDLLTRLTLFELVEDADASTFVPLPADRRARRVAETVLADPAGAHDLDDLARAAHASSRTITRLFPAETGMTFKEWRQRARIVAAIEMLGSGSGSIKEVAGRLGFASAAAFSYAFREVTGEAPSRSIQKSAAPLRPRPPSAGAV